jgi:hypothetical protein
MLQAAHASRGTRRQQGAKRIPRPGSLSGRERPDPCGVHTPGVPQDHLGWPFSIKLMGITGRR